MHGVRTVLRGTIAAIANDTGPRRRTGAGPGGNAGDGLLSHDLAIAVPSALTGLTTVFGMGTGVALSR